MVGRLISETLWGKKANGPTALDPYRRFAPSPFRGVLRLRAGWRSSRWTLLWRRFAQDDRFGFWLVRIEGKAPEAGPAASFGPLRPD